MKDLSMSHPYNLRERRAVKEKASKTSPANASTPLDSPPSRLTVTLPVTLHELALPMEMEQSPECHEFIIDTQGSPKLRKKLPESFWNDDDGSNEIRPTREGSPLTLLGWPETYEEDKYYASSQPSLSKCERGSPLLSDKPVRRSLMSELMMNAENESVEEELSDQERRKSFIQSFIEAEMEEDERAEDLTDLPPITAPPPRRPSGHYESTFSSNAAYDDDIDAFFSNSHAEDNGPEFVLSAAYKMSLLHNKPHRQDFITLQPHFLTAEYFKTHKPNDGQPAVEEEDERKVNPAPYYSYQFKFMGRLGSGEYADVWRAQDVTTQKLYAIKQTREQFTSQSDRWLLLAEVENLHAVKGSPHCVELVSAWEQEGYLFIQMELCESGSLAEYISHKDGQIEEDVLWNIIYELAKGLRDIHNAQVAHLDLKPSNILLDETGNLRIGDFGFSLQCSGEPRDIRGEGDRRYMAPDLLKDHFDMPADIYSFGLILLEMVTRTVLPDTGESWEMLRLGDFSDYKMTHVSQALQDLIRRLLTLNEKDRPTAQELLDHDDLKRFKAQDSSPHKGALYEYVKEIQDMSGDGESRLKRQDTYSTPKMKTDHCWY